MGHASYDDLEDLEAILETVRGWELVQERSPGCFYMRGKGFLHFHTKGEARWADARLGAEWGPKLDIPYDASATARKRFVRDLKRCHRETLAALRKK